MKKFLFILLFLFAFLIFAIASYISLKGSFYIVGIAQAIIAWAILYILKRLLRMKHKLTVSHSTYEMIKVRQINIIEVGEEVQAGDTIFFNKWDSAGNCFTGDIIEVFALKTFKRKGSENVNVTFRIVNVINPRVQGKLF